MKNLKTLLEEYQVRLDYNIIESNLVYPFDNRNNGYIFCGYVNSSEIDHLAQRIRLELDIIRDRDLSTRISNKYAIPFLQVEVLRSFITYFYYQHDDKVWLISKTEPRY